MGGWVFRGGASVVKWDLGQMGMFMKEVTEESGQGRGARSAWRQGLEGKGQGQGHEYKGLGLKDKLRQWGRGLEAWDRIQT